MYFIGTYAVYEATPVNKFYKVLAAGIKPYNPFIMQVVNCPSENIPLIPYLSDMSDG